MITLAVYVDGEEKATGNVSEVRMPDGTKIMAAFYRGAFGLAHISFSNNRPPIEL